MARAPVRARVRRAPRRSELFPRRRAPRRRSTWPPTPGSGDSWRRRTPHPRWGACSCYTGSSPSHRPSPWGSHRVPLRCQASERRPGRRGRRNEARCRWRRRSSAAACGEPNPAGSAFCVFCGTYLGWEQPGHEPSPPASAAPSASGAGVGTSPSAVPPSHPAGTPAPPPSPAPPSGPPPATVRPPSGTPCPQCGQDNPATRRFCSRCGHQLVAAAAPPTRAPAARPADGWDPERTGGTSGVPPEPPRALPLAPGSRGARPCWWRVAVVLTLTGNNPMGWAQDRWRDLTVDLRTARRRDRRRLAAGHGGGDVRRQHSPRPAAGRLGDRVAGGRRGDGEVLARARRMARSCSGGTSRRGCAGSTCGRDSTRTARAATGSHVPERLAVSWDDRCVQLPTEDTPDRQTLEFDTVRRSTSCWSRSTTSTPAPRRRLRPGRDRRARGPAPARLTSPERPEIFTSGQRCAAPRSHPARVPGTSGATALHASDRVLSGRTVDVQHVAGSARQRRRDRPFICEQHLRVDAQVGQRAASRLCPAGLVVRA